MFLSIVNMVFEWQILSSTRNKIAALMAGWIWFTINKTAIKVDFTQVNKVQDTFINHIKYNNGFQTWIIQVKDVGLIMRLESVSCTYKMILKV